jgi:hypothetical protein
MQIRARDLKEGINNCRHALALYGKTVTTENKRGQHILNGLVKQKNI